MNKNAEIAGWEWPLWISRLVQANGVAIGKEQPYYSSNGELIKLQENIWKNKEKIV